MIRQRREDRAARLFRHAHPAPLPGGWAPSSELLHLALDGIRTNRYTVARVNDCRLALYEGINAAEREGLGETRIVERARVLLRALGALDAGDRDTMHELIEQAVAVPRA